MATNMHNSWASVTARGTSQKVIRPLHVLNQKDSPFQPQSKVIYESDDLDYILRMQKATAIVKQALTPDSILFSFSASVISHQTEAYKLIESQCGAVHGFRPISNFGSNSNGDLLIEAKFVDDSGAEKAVSTGVTVKDKVIKGTYSSDPVEYSLVHVKMSLLYFPDQEDFLEHLMSSPLFYGQVLQVKEYICGGYFEGELSVIMNTSCGYDDDLGNHYANEPLTNNLYLHVCDCFMSASFKGASTVCHWCHHAGHVRSKCPELAKMKCLSCQCLGHTAKFCKKKNSVRVPTDVASNEAVIKPPTILVPSGSDSDTDLSDISMSSKFVQSGSLASKYATTVDTVPMKFDEPDIISSATPPKAETDSKIGNGDRKMLGQKRSVLGKPKGMKPTLKGPAPKLVVKTPTALKGHKLFMKTKVAKP
ncbi:hypothetical protein INT47_012074 [Mucor saturninus]|uniref:CCHC-type domain-containing protein n=1 Tax=Mucor saturninus TaxID=64648 RepID=A0A8H7QM18_9FUNG|nr:hypothetical protein INT47_012074 [Mucor saturninus]